jgi:hypothetical protein
VISSLKFWDLFLSRKDHKIKASIMSPLHRSASNMHEMPQVKRSKSPDLKRTAMRRTKKQPAFSLFGRLPPEMRIMIWNHAARQERKRLFYIKMVLSGARHQSHRYHVPSILKCNQESRHEALQHYNLCQERRVYPNKAVRGVYIDFSKDEFMFKRHSQTSPRGRIGPDTSCYNFTSSAVQRIPHIQFNCYEYRPFMLEPLLRLRNKNNDLRVVFKGPKPAKRSYVGRPYMAYQYLSYQIESTEKSTCFHFQEDAIEYHEWNRKVHKFAFRKK